MVAKSQRPSVGASTPSLKMSRTAWLTTAVMAFRRCLSRMTPVFHAELAAELPVRPDGLAVEVVDEFAVAMERGSEYGRR
eukprot:14892124-Heterocapsa_arctica.AAC.1